MDKKLYFKHGVIEHPKDIEYFTQYPAPIMELIHSAHNVNINATIPFFGPMLYFLVRALKCEGVLEIGHAECYTAWYLAHAVNDNAVRHNLPNPMYYGIDIVKTEEAKETLTKAGLPNTIVNLDTINLNETTFKGVQFDLIFQDGCHEEKYVLHEMEVLWPQLRGNGLGYWIMHDCYGPCEDAFRKLIPMFGKDVEWCRLDDGIYGLAILRKMDGYDYGRKHWRN